MKFKQYMDNNRHPDHHWLCKRITCKDGFSMSVQASEHNYCYPRDNFHSYSFYDEFEIGFPSEEEPLIIQYAEDRDYPTETVYGCVPDSVIQEVIEKHGGLNKGD